MRHWRKLLYVLLPASLVFTCNPGFAQDDDDEEVFELSPFEVSAEDSQGYLATTTLAGTRLRSNIGDLGSAISVITPEFMEDIAATDSTELLSYTLNTEIGGVQGNYTGDTNQSSQRVQPQNAQRVRGLAAATLTRNYFLTQIPFESYNTTRITINRGPNSLLFGVGTPGGIIENSLSRAQVDRDFGQVSLRLGERSSHRMSFNINKALIEGRLAIRVAGLRKDTNYQQEPAFELDERLYVAGQWVLRKQNPGFLGRTVLRANYEKGEIQSNRPNVVPPVSGIQHWFETPDTTNDGKYGKNFDAWVTDGSFIPKITVDNRAGQTNGQIPGQQTLPFFIQVALVNSDPESGMFDSYDPSDPDLVAFQGRRFYRGNFTDENGVKYKRREFWGTSWFSDGTGFAAPTLPYHVFNNNRLIITGDSNRVYQDFDAYNFTLEQGFKIFGFDAGAEASFDRQDYEIFRDLAYSNNTANQVRIDINEYISDGRPNPNVGRPFIETDTIRNTRSDDNYNEAHRVTAYIELDLEDRIDNWFGKLLGRHVVTGYTSYQETFRSNLSYKYTWSGNEIESEMQRILGGGGLNAWRRNVNNVMYIGPSLLGPEYQTQDDVRLTQQINAPALADGDVFKVSYWDPADGQHKVDNWSISNNLNGAGLTLQEIESEVISLQSFLFGGHIVGLAGWRSDSAKTWTRIPQSNTVDWTLPDRTQDPATIILEDSPSLVADGDSFTWSIVGHLPERFNPFSDWLGISAHIGESENFQPTQARRNILNEPIAPTAGVTEEHGFTLNFFDNKFSARMNWFETKQTGSTLGGSWVGQLQSQTSFWLNRWNEARNSGIPFDEAYTFALGGLERDNAIAAGATDPGFTSYDDIMQAIIDLMPEPLKSFRNVRVEDTEVEFNNIIGLQSTTDRVAEGFEIELVANPTPNWRIALNVGKQETVRSNSAPVITPIIEQFNANLAASGLYYLFDSPNINETNQHFNRFNGRVNNGHQAALANDGQVVNEQRKWRANLVTNYNFVTDNWLDGFGIGGAVRYQDKVAIGYPLLQNEAGLFVPDLMNPYWGPDATSGDVWVSYRGKWGEKRYRIQLNVRNAFADLDPIPFDANPDGSYSRYRNAPTREFWLTYTLNW